MMKPTDSALSGQMSMRGFSRWPTQRGGIISKLIFLCAFAAFLFVLYLFRAPILRETGKLWVVDDGARAADAIIVLSDDDYQADRATKAAELIRAGWAPRVVASGRMLRPYAGISELMERDLADRGVPRSAILRFPSASENTREEAEALERFVAQQGWHHVLVVTSNYHTRRARMIYDRVFPANIEVRFIAAPDHEYDPANWWQTHSGKKHFFYELGGYILARWELRDSKPAAT